MDGQNLFVEFLKKPCRETYLAVYAQVTSSEAYNPYGTGVDDLGKLFESGKYEEVRKRAHALMPGWLLSPRLHFMLAFASEKLGDTQTYEAEGIIATACIEGILSTGDGSAERPYVVTSTLDEYDIVLHQQKKPKLQRLLHRRGKQLDCLTFTDESVMYFDVTTPYATLGSRSLKR